MQSVSAKLMRRATATCVLCVAVVVVAYVLAVWTPAGQRFEDAVLAGATLATGGDEQSAATRALRLVSAPTISLATALILGIGLARRRPLLALLGAGVVGASVGTAEVLRHAAFRPILLAHGTRRVDQSFPSGHAAVTMSVMFGLLLVMPARFRRYAVVVLVPWAIGTAVATVAASWHRPSDTAGSEAIALGYACLAVVVLAKQAWVRQETAAPLPGRGGRYATLDRYLPVVVVALAMIVSVGWSVAGGLRNFDVNALSSVAFMVGCTVVAACGGVATIVFLGLLQDIDVGDRSARALVPGVDADVDSAGSLPRGGHG